MALLCTTLVALHCWGTGQDSISGQLGAWAVVVASGSIAAFPNALLECVAFGAIPSIPTVSH